MRCLFCGKELALLKRLRGGGEFCSEAHRKEYQEQYEQLALARLLQAKPPAEQSSLGQVPLGQSTPPAPIVPNRPVENPRAEVLAPARPEPQAPARPSVRMIEAPQPAEEAGPAPLAGFVGDPVVPAVATFQHAGSLELARVATHSPSLPTAVMASGTEESLAPAPRVEFAHSLQALDHHTRGSERGVELREFAGPAPVMDLHLRPATGTEPAEAADVMEILMSPHPPQKATPWLGPPQGFPTAPAELGQLARLDFSTTGFAYSDGPVPETGARTTGAPQAAVLTPEAPQTQEPGAPIVPEIANALPAEAPPAPAEPAPPPLVNKALPVTLHGLAAPRGQWAHTYTSAITAASDVQIPPSTALPLRPAIVFGPAPAPTPAAAPAQEQVKPAQVKPVPEKTESSFRSSMVPVPKGVPVKRPAAPETVTPEIKAPKVATPVATPAEDTRAEPRKESSAPRPVEVSAASDSAIPSLRVEATESAWSKLSTSLKIGVAAAIIVAISGIAYVVTRGGSKATNQAPVAATPAAPTVASGVPISGGWIDDWANAAKSRRHISMLSGSAKLSDYRLEFQAQIQTKAIGWIFRGLNPRNYYVTKIEAIKPGLDPTVALVHFAVVDGIDENRVVVPLPMKVRVDTTYKVRFEAIGNRFITWVQDQKIDEWTDSRFGSGGVGLFSDRDEQAALQGTVNVVALVPKN